MEHKHRDVTKQVLKMLHKNNIFDNDDLYYYAENADFSHLLNLKNEKICESLVENLNYYLAEAEQGRD